MTRCCGSTGSKCERFFQKISKEAVKERLLRLFPIITWLPNYKLADLRYDIIAGLTVGLTMVPQALAYAQMANLNLQYGLYSSFIGQIIYVFMGTSKDANIGPSAILSVLTGQISAEIMPNQLLDRGDPTCATLMAFMCGLIMMLMGICQLGFLVNLFSIPVVAGFTSAAGFAIFASQLSNFLGLKTVAFRPPGIFVKQIKAVIENWRSTNFIDVAFGASSLVFLLFMQYLSRIINRLCLNSCRRATRGKHTWQNAMEALRLFIASRNVIVFFVATGVAFHLKQVNPDFKVSLVGKIAKGFPKFNPPKFYLTNGSDVLSPTPDEEDFLVSGDEPIVLRPAVDLMEVLSPGFLIISLMASMELFAITKALGRKNNYRVDASQELIVVGMSNFLQSFIHGFPVTSAVARSALADQCRVKTQLAGLISAIVVLVAIGVLSETFQYIPKACLSAIIIGTSFNLIDLSILRSMWRLYRQDIFLLAATFVICLFWDIAYGILLCLLLNMITFLRPVVRMKIHIEEQGLQLPGAEGKVVVVRLSQGMRYPSADKFTDRISTILSHDDDKHIVIDCQFVTHVDYTGLQAFRSLLLAAVQKSKHIIFTNLSDKLQKHLACVGLEHFKYVTSVDEAVRLYNVRSATPPIRFVSTGDNASENGSPVGEMAFEADQAVENPRFLKELSLQPSFYGDIPITVGNISKVVRESDKDGRRESSKQGNKTGKQLAAAAVASSSTYSSGSPVIQAAFISSVRSSNEIMVPISSLSRQAASSMKAGKSSKKSSSRSSSSKQASQSQAASRIGRDDSQQRMKHRDHAEVFVKVKSSSHRSHPVMTQSHSDQTLRSGKPSSSSGRRSPQPTNRDEFFLPIVERPPWSPPPSINVEEESEISQKAKRKRAAKTLSSSSAGTSHRDGASGASSDQQHPADVIVRIPLLADKNKDEETTEF